MEEDKKEEEEEKEDEGTFLSVVERRPQWVGEEGKLVTDIPGSAK